VSDGIVLARTRPFGLRGRKILKKLLQGRYLSLMFKIEVTELLVLVDELHLLTFEGADDFIGRVNKTVRIVVMGSLGAATGSVSLSVRTIV
jgi:hypothetical protein